MFFIILIVSDLYFLSGGGESVKEGEVFGKLLNFLGECVFSIFLELFKLLFLVFLF